MAFVSCQLTGFMLWPLVLAWGGTVNNHSLATFLFAIQYFANPRYVLSLLSSPGLALLVAPLHSTPQPCHPFSSSSGGGSGPAPGTGFKLRLHRGFIKGQCGTQVEPSSSWSPSPLQLLRELHSHPGHRDPLLQTCPQQHDGARLVLGGPFLSQALPPRRPSPKPPKSGDTWGGDGCRSRTSQMQALGRGGGRYIVTSTTPSLLTLTPL